MGEGWRRAHALASCPAAGGSPFGRDSSYFQSGRKVPGSHPSSSRPAGLLRALPAAAAARTLGSARSAPLAAPRPRAQTRCRNTRGFPVTHTCCSGTTPTQRARTRTPTPSHTDARTSREGACRGREAGDRRRGRAPTPYLLSRQVHCGGAPPNPGTHPAASGSWLRDWTEPPPSLSSALGGVGAGTGRVRAGGVGRCAAPPHTREKPTPTGCSDRRSLPGLAGVEGRGANCGPIGETLAPSQHLLAQTRAGSV